MKKHTTITPNHPIPIKVWEGVYDDHWKRGNMLVPAAFAHPAKMARGLADRIFDYALSQGWIKKGDLVGDCFGGVGTGGVIAAYKGLRWIGVELESKANTPPGSPFVELARENFALHASRWETLGALAPLIIQGDSRNFHQIVAEALAGSVAGVISSPPFSAPGMQPKIGQGSRSLLESKGQRPETNGKGQRSARNIEALDPGDLNAVVSSPPFAHTVATQDPNFLTPCEKQKRRPSKSNLPSYGESKGQIGSLKEGRIDAAVSSPPYAGIAAGAGGLNHKPARKAGQQSGRRKGASQNTDQHYGTTNGQIARTAEGSVDACVSSPPYADSLEAKKGGIDFSKSFDGRNHNSAGS